MNYDQRITVRMNRTQRHLLLKLAQQVGKGGNESAGFRELCGRYQKASQELNGASADGLAAPAEAH